MALELEDTEKMFGWIADEYDGRDHRYIPDPVLLHQLKGMTPVKIDLRNQANTIAVYSQGSLGSCTANACCFAYRYTELKQQLEKTFSPSRLFLYYNTRAIMGTTGRDSGASIRNTLKAAYNTGICTEGLWPYKIENFTTKPTQNCYDQASQCKILEYVSVAQTLADIKSVLVEGYPIVFGFNVYESFKKTSANGLMPMPMQNEKILGGHAVCIVGYDDTISFGGDILGGLIVRNSWGSGWGDHGYFYMPYTIAINPSIARDFWFIKKITFSNVIDEPSSCCCFTC